MKCDAKHTTQIREYTVLYSTLYNVQLVVYFIQIVEFHLMINFSFPLHLASLSTCLSLSPSPHIHFSLSSLFFFPRFIVLYFFAFIFCVRSTMFLLRTRHGTAWYGTVRYGHCSWTISGLGFRVAHFEFFFHFSLLLLLMLARLAVWLRAAQKKRL